MKKVGENAFRVGWYVSKLMDAGLNVTPIMEDGIYTDTVDWRVEGPDNRYVSVQLTIDPEVPQ